MTTPSPNPPLPAGARAAFLVDAARRYCRWVIEGRLCARDLTVEPVRPIFRAALREEMLARYATLGEWAVAEREPPFPVSAEAFLQPHHLATYAEGIARLAAERLADPVERDALLAETWDLRTETAWEEHGLATRMDLDREEIDRAMEEAIYQAEQRDLAAWRDGPLARHLVGVPQLRPDNLARWEAGVRHALQEASARTRELVARYGPPYPATRQAAELIQRWAWAERSPAAGSRAPNEAG